MFIILSLTVLFCVSSEGEKFKPLVIGKSENPRCFKNIDKARLPAIYRANKRSWMTSQLFAEWLQYLNQRFKNANKQAVLFLDNAPVHPHIDLSNITLQFLPPNTTAATQPLDQGIIRSFKAYYRKAMLHLLVRTVSEVDTVQSVIKDINVFTAINFIDKAWESVTQQTIVNCFRKAGLIRQSSLESSEIEEIGNLESLNNELIAQAATLIPQDQLISLEQWNDFEGFEPWGVDATALALPQPSSSQETQEEEEDEDEDEIPIVFTNREASKALEGLKMYAISKGVDMKQIKGFERAIEEAMEESKKQGKITDFFQRQN